MVLGAILIYRTVASHSTDTFKYMTQMPYSGSMFYL